jgi:uncharacterized membrane protein YidH (DUF202 family)
VERLKGGSATRGIAHSVMGLALVAAGLLTLVAAARHFTTIRRGIQAGDDTPAAVSSLPLLVAVLIGIAGTALMVYLWWAPR